MASADFDQPSRARSYIEANERDPEVRVNPVEAILSRLAPGPGERILEIGPGSGLLSRRLLDAVGPSGTVVAIEPSAIMKEHLERRAPGLVTVSPSESGVLAPGCFSAAASLGTFHHVSDKLGLLRAVRRTLTESGRLVIGDVAQGTPVQRYFDEAVDRICSTGHRYAFLDEDWLRTLGERSGLVLESWELVAVPWRFHDRDHAGRFLRALHDATCSEEECFALAERYVGFHDEGESGLALDWKIFRAVLRRGPAPRTEDETLAALRIRPFSPQDAEAAATVARSAAWTMTSYSAAERQAIADVYRPEALRSWHGDPDYVLRVAEIAGRVVAFAGFHRGRVRGLYLLPGWTRAGIGSRLVNELVRLTSERALVSLETRAAPEARAFYERNGFRFIGERDFPLGELSIHCTVLERHDEPSEAARLTQLTQLNERVRMHAGRLWQLPFAFFGLLALSLPELVKLPAGLASWCHLVLTLVGLAVTWAMRGAYEGVTRGSAIIEELEASLGLGASIRRSPARRLQHFVPYFAIVGLGIAVCAGLGLLRLLEWLKLLR